MSVWPETVKRRRKALNLTQNNSHTAYESRGRTLVKSKTAKPIPVAHSKEKR